MDCIKVSEHFSDYYEGNASEPLASRIAAHINGCAECSLNYARFVRAMSLLNEPIEEFEAPSRLRTSVMARVAEIEAKRRPSVIESVKSFFQSYKTGLAVAASCVIVITAIFAHTDNNSHALPGVVVSGSPTVLAYRGAFQSTQVSENGDKTFYTFSVRLPANISSGSIKAFILRKNSALESDTSLLDSDNAANIWSSDTVLTRKDLISIPVAVPTTKIGEPLVLLIQSTSVTPGKAQRDIAIVPSGISSSKIPAGSSMLTTLEKISSSSNQQIFIDNTGLTEILQSAYSAPNELSASTSVNEIVSNLYGATVVAAPNSNAAYIVGQ